MDKIDSILDSNVIKQTKNYIEELESLVPSKSDRFKFKIRVPLNITLLTITLVLLLHTAYILYYSDKIIPGIKIANVSVGGLTYDLAKSKLQDNIAKGDTELVFTNGIDLHVTSLDKLGVTYNLDAALLDAFNKGRSAGIISNFYTGFRTLFVSSNIELAYTYNSGSLDSFISSITGANNHSSKDATFVIRETGLEITSSAEGLVVDSPKLREQVLEKIKTQDFTLQTLPVKEERPNAYTQDLLLIKDVVAQIIYNPLTLDHKDTQITLKPELILSFLNVSTSSYELSQLDHSGFMYYQTPDKRVAVSLNYPVFKNYAQTTIAPKVFTSPRAKVKATKDGKVESLEVTKQGQDLDLEKFTYDFSQALFKFKDTVTIPTKQFSFDGDAKSLGIKERLARGDSTYRGSALSREHNLLLAAERADGVLVPPNGIYSFNEAVGDISAETGYDSAFIINNGQTVLGSGGGVCQTSTTLFRAVLNSGLPVVSRNAHAYRVRYYELDSAVGFDAAIFQPTLDFKFKNDTKDYILVTAFHDTESKTLHFDIYGTPDGRTVQITEPVQTNVTAPPEPVYKDDPTLAKGVTKQVEWAAWGSTVSFARTVKRGDEVLSTDTYTSRYQPWQAVYLVGTKTN